MPVAVLIARKIVSYSGCCPGRNDPVSSSPSGSREPPTVACGGLRDEASTFGTHGSSAGGGKLVRTCRVTGASHNRRATCFFLSAISLKRLNAVFRFTAHLEAQLGQRLLQGVTTGVLTT